jgi:hypothetical protein
MSTTITAISQLLDALGRVPFITGVLTKGSLLILIAVGLTRLLARSPAAARHLVWTLSVAGLLLLPRSSRGASSSRFSAPRATRSWHRSR